MARGSAPAAERSRGEETRLARTRRETSVRFGDDARLIAAAVLMGAGLGGFLHRLLVWSFGRWDRLAVAHDAGASSLRDVLLTIGPWAALVVGAIVYATTDRERRARWGLRRVVGVPIAIAGFLVLVVGELEVHAFRTLLQGWKPHDLFWDVVFHVPGEAIAFAGWLLLPIGPTRIRGAG